MKTNTRETTEARRSPLAKASLLLAMVSLTRFASAQTIVAPLSDATSIPSQMTISSPAMDMRQTPLNGGLPATDGIPFGPFTEHPHVTYRFLYGNSIQATPGHSDNTAINSFSPGLLTEFGNHWTLDYTPTWNYYSSKAFQDSTDHALALAFNTAYQDWTLGFNQDINANSSPLVEIGGQTRQHTYLTRLNSTYQYASGFMLESTATQNLQLLQGFNDTREWSLLEYLHYQVAPQLNTAIGFSYAYDKASESPDSAVYQVLTRIGWHPYFPMSFEIEAGVEDRDIRERGSSSHLNPVLNASIRYQPVTTTSLSLHAGRSTQLSAIANQFEEADNIGLTLEQRLFAQYHCTFGVIYDRTKYTSTLPSGSETRADNSLDFNASIGTTLLRRVTASLTYYYNQNRSSLPGFAFSSSQIGIELGYKY